MVGFIRKNKKENWVNCNYYDFDWLFEKLESFIITQLKEQIAFGIDTSTCFVLGKKMQNISNASMQKKAYLIKSLFLTIHDTLCNTNQNKVIFLLKIMR